jgi:serine/threonine protein kinase
MMPVDPRRAKELFNAALELTVPAERPAFLDRECGDDTALRRRVEELLAAHERPASVLERPLAAGRTAATAADHGADQTAGPSNPPNIDEAATSHHEPESPPQLPLIGEMIAERYKIRQMIGEGAMGTVYLAEQTQPLKRQVALKLIKVGMDSRTVLARFESERQALALMEHPNIAKVLDAGTSEAGRPFFVMELVKGAPLTDYCDQHCLGMPERLTLFRQICSAVQHAHQKGIIHRDLKPSNILVENHDGNPVPKVIDFGLAKATSGMPLSDFSMISAFGLVAGTPIYMAPEQATPDALDIDTRADIYALGVILYELLTGSTPIQRGSFQLVAFHELLRVIREVEPPIPSSRIRTSETLVSLAAVRQTEPARLGRFVRGDLDWIVMKALAKERRRRYDSAGAFALDIERFLNHEPVSAGPPTAVYRLRKFIRRNRLQVVAASLVLLALVAGIVGTTLGLVEASRQGKEAEKRLSQVEKSIDILGSVFKDLDPAKADEEDKPLLARLGERLDQATAQIEGDAIGDPLSVARMQKILGTSQLGLGNPKKAIGLLTKARETFTALLGSGDRDTLNAMGSLAIGFQNAGKLKQALPLYEETLALMKPKLGADDPDTLVVMNNLANCYRDDGSLDRALPLLEETLKLMKAKRGPDHRDALVFTNNLASAYHERKRFYQAQSLLEEALPLMKTKLGRDNSDTLINMNNLAMAYQEDGKVDLALPLLDETFKLRKAKLGLEHPDTLVSMTNLGFAFQEANKLDMALPLFEDALKIRTAKLGPEHPSTLNSMNRLAVAYHLKGHTNKSLPLFEEMLRLRKAISSPDHPDTLEAIKSLANAYHSVGKFDRITPLLHDLAEGWKRKAGADSTEYARALRNLGFFQLQQKMWVDAEPILRDSLRISEKKEPDAWATFDTRSLLGAALLGQKKIAEAEPLLRAAYEGLRQRVEKIPQHAKFRLGEVLDLLMALAEAKGKPDDAKFWSDEKKKRSQASTALP